MSDLRDKIARALGAGLEDHERPVFAGRQLAATQAEAIADAVLAVLDLDKVRAEAFEQGIRSAIDAVNKTGNHAPLVKAYLRKAEQ